MSAEAATLKERGNALFAKKDYQAAIAKYTAAISLDGQNAVLYSNRAACYQGLKRFELAEADAIKATELDPEYSKAWARLATAQEALERRPQAVESLQRALTILPKDSSNDKQRSAYEASMKQLMPKPKPPPVSSESPKPAPAREKMRSSHFTDESSGGSSSERIKPSGFTPAPTKMPGKLLEQTGTAAWDRARLMLPRLRSERNRISSAWVITEAYDTFTKGTAMMMSQTAVRTPDGLRIQGQRGVRFLVIDELSNAILKDVRAFHMDGRKWMDAYWNQQRYEVALDNAPEPDADVHTTIAHVRRLMRAGGWDAVRPALITTVRCIIMIAFISIAILGQEDQCVRVFDKAVDIINWVRAEWPDVPREERGTIFEEFFLYSVRSLRLERYIEAYSQTQRVDPRFTLGGILSEASQILKIQLSLNSTINLGFHSPILSILKPTRTPEGFYHMQTAIVAYNNGSGPEDTTVVKELRAAAQSYETAGRRYPTDDEKHAQFIDVALLALFRAHAPLRDTIPLMAHLREADQERTKIWAFSTIARTLDASFWKVRKFEEEALKKIADVKWAMDDARWPSWATLEGA